MCDLFVTTKHSRVKVTLGKPVCQSTGFLWTVNFPYVKNYQIVWNTQSRKKAEDCILINKSSSKSTRLFIIVKHLITAEIALEEIIKDDVTLLKYACAQTSIT